MSNLNEDVKITPYKCRTLYTEYKELRSRKKNIVDFIVKADLLDLYREVEQKVNGKIEMAEFVHICMTIFMKIEQLYDTTNEPFQNYLDGLGTIRTCNETASWRKEKSCQEEIVSKDIGSSWVLNYIYFSLVNNKNERNKLNRDKLVEEISKQKSVMTSEGYEQALTTIHVKVRETSEIINEIKKLNINFETSDVMLMLNQIQDKVINLNKNKADNNFEKGLGELKNTVMITNQRVNELESVSQAMSTKHLTLTEELIARLQSDNEKVNRIKKAQESALVASESNDELLKSLSKRLGDSVSEIEKILGESTPMEDILETVKAVQDYVYDLQTGVKQQIVSSREIDSKVRTIEEGVSTIKKVINSLSEIMREDILIELARTQTQVESSADEVQRLGIRYKGIRNGGMSSGNIS